MQTSNSESNTQIFDLVKIKPFTELLRISPSRFTQKLKRYKIRGIEQKFSQEELDKIVHGLHYVQKLIAYEIDIIKEVQHTQNNE